MRNNQLTKDQRLVNKNSKISINHLKWEKEGAQKVQRIRKDSWKILFKMRMSSIKNKKEEGEDQKGQRIKSLIPKKKKNKEMS